MHSDETYCFSGEKIDTTEEVEDMVICEVTTITQTTMPEYAKAGHVKIEIIMDLDALED